MASPRGTYKYETIDPLTGTVCCGTDDHNTFSRSRCSKCRSGLHEHRALSGGAISPSARELVDRYAPPDPYAPREVNAGPDSKPHPYAAPDPYRKGKWQ